MRTKGKTQCRIDREDLWLAMWEAGWSLQRIGAAFYGKDHSTVRHGVANAERRRQALTDSFERLAVAV